MNILRVGSITAGGNIILVTTDSGATVYAVSGGKVVSGVAVGGVAKLKVKAGTWRVWAELGGQQTSEVEVIVTDTYYKEMSFGLPVSGLPVGALIKTNLSGAGWNFRIVHQGLPSSMYDASCDGTWLLMNDIYEKRQWHSSNSNSYKASTIHSYLNGDFLGLFDANVQNLIKQVKIPYVNGTGGSAVASGANGLSAQIFLLSGYEVGFTQSVSSYFPIDGAKLDYFVSGNDDTAKSKRIANLNGSATLWWLRSPYCRSNLGPTDALLVHTNGGWNYNYCSDSYGNRPSLILPSDAMYNPTPNADGSYTLIA